MCLRHFLHALEFFEARLRLTCLGGLGPEPAHEVLDVGNTPLLLVILRLLLGHLLGALALIVRVASPISRERLAGNLQRALAGGVDKVAVVGDHQQGAAIALKPALQPQRGVEIQVVGGLIEQHQVRGRHQRPGQIQSNTPAPGKARHGGFHFFSLKPKAQQQLLCATLGAVAVELFHSLMQRG